MSGGTASTFGRFRNLLGSGRDGASDTEMPRSDQERLLELAIDYERSGMGWFWSTNAEGRLTYVSACVSQILGVESQALVGQPVQSLFVLERDEDDQVERTLPLILSARKTFADLPVKAASDQVERWWAIAGRPQFDGQGNFRGYHGNGIDVTATRQSHKDASRLAQYDSLTGLANRHRMAKRIGTILTAYKAAKRSCAIFMLDLDRFKQVNDTLGHQAGDELLKQVAQRLQRVLPDKTYEIGRLGGDEFQVILPDIDDRGRLGEIAMTVITMLSQPYQIENSRCVIGASVGIAIAPYDGITSEELVRSADLALYAAKGAGRGQFRFYSSDLHSEAERRRQIEDDLREVLSTGQMRIAYQPIVDAETNRVITLEAFSRWNHPDLGDIPPSVFIPIAEETNLIGALGDWVMKQACNDAAAWPGDARVAVNVSAAQFANPGFAASVAQALSQSGLSPDRLEIELTETVMIGDEQGAQKVLESLKMLGVRLALDDFGTGYSSLSYLQHAPFDKIKIDKAFIRGITDRTNRNSAIIGAIVSLANSLEMEVTAEGIEAHDELKAVRKLGVNQIQGFIYAQAMWNDNVCQAMLEGDWVIEPNGPSHYRPERRTVLRKVGMIHEDHRYDAMMRNLSRTGCMVEGLLDVPVGTSFVIDFGEGQLAVGIVRRSVGAMLGMEFEVPLVDDGAGGLCTRHRVSPYALAQAGMPLAALPPGSYPLHLMQQPGVPLSLPKFGTAEVKTRGFKVA